MRSSALLPSWHLQPADCEGDRLKLHATPLWNKGLAVREFRSVRYRIKEAGPPLLLCEAVLPQEVLLGMAGHLCWGPCCDEVPGNASPVALPEFLEAGKEYPVLFLGPWNSCQFDYSGVQRI